MVFDIYVNQNSRVSLQSLIAKPEIHLQSQPYPITVQRQPLRLTPELRKTSIKSATPNVAQTLRILSEMWRRVIWKKKRTGLRPPALFSPEAEDSHFLGYVSKFLPDYTTPYGGRHQWSYSVARPSDSGNYILVGDDDCGDGDQDDEDGDDDDVRYFNQWIRGFWLNTLSEHTVT